MSVHPKPSKLLSAPHPSNQDTENKDPEKSEVSRKAPVRSGGSRLPVLAKSLPLQTPSDFSQSHCRWEEKPLAVSASFPSQRNILCFSLIKLFFFSVLNSLSSPYRAKQGRKSLAPGPFHSTCRSPRVQEWLQKIGSTSLFHKQGLALLLSNLITVNMLLILKPKTLIQNQQKIHPR